MRLKTLAAGMTLAVAGFVTSAVQADLSVGVSTETQADTGLLSLDSGTSAEAGVAIGVGGSSQAGAQGEVQGESRQRSELAGDGRAEAEARIEQEGQAGLDTARDDVSRTGNETAAQARGQAQSTLGEAADTLDSVRESGEEWIEGGAAAEAQGSAGVTTEAH
ncbi:hypothetical protein [Halomonas sp. NCCP-2165]|nr:hypothetical protein [Halomonas sp. NCCP-2165]GKW50854.1 hypothetical protein NCCP2165_30690 [Halomonas sp. NCCP-2165]